MNLKISVSKVTFFSLCVDEVMKSLNSPQDYWKVEMASTDIQIHRLQEELEKVTLENSRLLERSTVSEGGRKALERGRY